ncbi:RNA polymerase II-associated protein 3 [Eucyclogobius newberryi]|uniref:RNA polymerase II-associated protein 3 n=1 Tax=Eucyclogobius newberryi TaxID=166745 RepID=UPI003B5B6265
MSGGNKALDLQHQMRQNSEDLQSFMRELDTWEKDVKKKDEQLRSVEVQGEEKKLPPIRNKDYKAKVRQKKKKKPSASNGLGGNEEGTTGEKIQARIKGYDYRSWDKFNVDKVLEEMDNEESPVESNESDSEEMPVDREKALAEKEKGNMCFKEGKYDEAIECYTRGMSADSYNPVLPTNRATAFFRLKKFAVAESDCNLAIALDSKYLKAFLRRGAARYAQKKYESALEDYEIVLKLDPGNTEAQNEVKKIKEIVGSNIAPLPEETALTKEAPDVDPEQLKQIEEQQRKQEAVLQKDRGNAYFKEGKYEAAVECYSRGMEADSMNVLLPANRAMAYLKLERFKEAEEDCTTAISLDNTYSKAFARRATARVSLGKLEEAKKDFQAVLKLEPGNKQALNELQKIQDVTSGCLQPSDCSQRRTVQPIEKPKHLQSTKPLRRVDIEEVSGKVLIADMSVSEPQDAEDMSPLSTSPSTKMIKIEEIADYSVCQSELPTQADELPHRLNTSAPDPIQPSSPVVDIPPPPPNSFQFESDLRTIGSKPEIVYSYLKQMNPEAFSMLFHNSLEPNILNQILKTLHGFYRKNETPALTFEILQNIASVRRFDMAVMFMSSSEKTVIRELFDFLHQSELEASSVTSLQKKYCV